MNEFLENLIVELYERDHEFGFCGHDIAGEPIEKIVRLVLERATQAVVEKLGEPHPSRVFGVNEVLSVLESLRV